MKKVFFALGVILSLSVAVVMPVPANAGPLSKGLQNLNEANKNTGLEKDLESTVGTVIKAVLAMVGTIFLGLTIYAGILWMTASGNEEQVTKATGIIKAAIIGLFITMSAYAITYFVTSKLGGDGATSGGGGSPGSPPPPPVPTMSISDCSNFGKPGGNGGGCLDAQYECDPPGTGSDDPYEGTSLGKCSGSAGGQLMDCCLFK